MCFHLCFLLCVDSYCFFFCSESKQTLLFTTVDESHIFPGELRVKNNRKLWIVVVVKLLLGFFMIISGILFTGLMCIRSFATSKREDFAVCSTMAERDASSTIFYDVGNSFMRYDSPLVCPRVHNTHKYRVAQKSKLLYCVNSLLFLSHPIK